MGFKESDEQIKKYIDALSFSEMAINIKLIHHDGLIDRSKNKSFVIDSDIKIEMLQKKTIEHRLYDKNCNRRENIYIYPSTNNVKYDFVFVDDLTQKSDYHRPFMAIQTSKEKYQTYYRLDEPTDQEGAKKIQQYLQEQLKADIGAIGANHPRRLPGFYNTKYEPKFFCKIVLISPAEVINTAFILDTMRQREQPTQHYNYIPRDTTQAKKQYKFLSDYSTTGDKSQDEFKYICYLIHIDKTDEEIREALLRESDIEKRKNKPEQYIRNSIKNARKRTGTQSF